MDPSGCPPEVEPKLAGAADAINLEVTGRAQGRIPKWNRDGAIAMNLRNLLAFAIEQARSADGCLSMFKQREPTSAELGSLLEFFARGDHADHVLPPVGTSEERMARYAKTIARVRREHPGAEPKELATEVVLACAKSYQVPRPSRFFDAEEKRERDAVRKSGDARGAEDPGG